MRPYKRAITMTIAERLPSFYIDVPALRPGTVGAYALAFASAGFATVLRLAVDPYVGGVPFITFWPAVIITALISGFGAGLFCVALSAAAADFFVLEPRWSFYVENPADVADLLLFALLACFCVIIISQMRDGIERDQARKALQASKDQLQASKDQLQASKDRLQLALDAAGLGWWRYDPLRRMILVDTRLKEIFDFTADETPLEEFVKRVHPDDLERVWSDRKAALDPADPKRYAHEYRIRRRDGKVRWVDVHGLAYFEGAGRERRVASFIGTAADITERKDREEREHLLMREVNHRAKNMLSVVASIAHQTVTKNSEDFIECFSERIQALSANQDLLVRSEWGGVDIEDLVRAQLDPFTDLVGSRIIARGPKLRLNAASAQAIGLALHELATNAGKYGALSTDAGRLDIGWGANGDTFTMNWTEREGPPVSAPKQLGFGTIVMEAMVERSVNGAVDLHYPPSGLTWRLTCPAVNALEHEPDFRAPN
jgi:PAS domain S-box-containing protein